MITIACKPNKDQFAAAEAFGERADNM